MSRESQTPVSLGYRWPAEWEPHAATWLAWPHNRETWPGKFDAIGPVWTELVRVLAEHETVNILAGGDTVMRQATAMVGSLSNVVLHDIATNDAWARDFGPVFLQHAGGGATAVVDWKYNAWGGKYPPFDKDNAVPARVARAVDLRRFSVDLVLEAGAIDGNGRGTILASHACLFHSNRNPGVPREAMEQAFVEFLGAKKILWVTGELAGDDTDGHVDQLVRFVGPRAVVVATESDATDENYQPLLDLHRQVVRMTDQDGATLSIVPLPLPRAVHYGGRRLPASYVNFYVANSVVIVPQFDDPADQLALDVLAAQFPTRRIVGIRAVDLVWGLGAFHCVTQQQPA